MATILVIDDDAAFRSTMSDVLRQAGHVVEAAPDGKQGLAIYNAGRHDLIITDIVMPNIEGLELIDCLRRADPRPRVIAISGDSKFSDSVYLPAARHLGVQRTLTKPIRPDALLRVVAEVLSQPPAGSVPPPGQ